MTVHGIAAGRWLVLGRFLILALAASCGGDTDGGSEPTRDAVGLEAWPAALDLVSGRPATAAIVISRRDGVDDAVTLSISDVPPGVQARVTPSPTTGVTGTLSLELVTNAEPGVYTVHLAATARGRADATIALPVSVQTGPFAMRAEPAAFDLVPGGQIARGTISIERTSGFVWDVVPQVLDYPVTVFAGTHPTQERDVWELEVNPGRASEPIAFTLVIQGGVAVGAPPGSTSTLVVPVRLRTPP